MALFISHASALRMLMSPRLSSLVRYARLADDDAIALESEPSAIDESVSRLCVLLGISEIELGRIDLIVRRGTSRKSTSRVRYHSWSGSMPRGAFLRVADGLYLSTPEFCFLQLAGSLPMTDLLLLGMALCGSYFPADTERGFVDGSPTTSVSKLTAFLADAKRCKGVDRARSATAHLVDGARSPMESSLLLVLTLPRTMGGFGLAKPTLNGMVRLSDGARAIFGYPILRPDLLFPGALLIIEYLGRAFHKDPERDIRRELALRHDGFDVQFVSIGQIMDSRQLYEIVKRVASATGKKMRPASAAIVAKRIALIDRLIPKRENVLDGECLRYERTWWALPRCLA